MAQHNSKVTKFWTPNRKQHNSSTAPNLQSQPVQHNSGELAASAALLRHEPTIPDFRMFRAHLYVGGLLTEAENTRIAKRIERLRVKGRR